MLNKNVMFYGASVTHQTGNSSYFESLTNSNFIFTRMSYPSSQFYNAGFYNTPRINDAQKKPDIVFFEWSTTGENEFDDLKLKYFVKNIINNNILPIFLILPIKDTYKNNRPCDDQLYKMNSDFGIPLLDLRGELINNNPDHILRDNVHTTELGAKLYAYRIDHFLKTQIFIDPKEIQLQNVLDFDIDIYDLNCIISANQSLNFAFSSSRYSEIAISHRIGPYSPVLEYFSDGILVAKNSIFDPWCHYERDNFTTLVPQSIFSKITKNSLSIKISSDSPDFSISKTGEIFDLPKKLDIKSIFTCDLKDFSYSIN